MERSVGRGWSAVQVGPDGEPSPAPEPVLTQGVGPMEDAPEVLLRHGGQGLDVGPGLGAHRKGLRGPDHAPAPLLPKARQGLAETRPTRSDRPGSEPAHTIGPLPPRMRRLPRLTWLPMPGAPPVLGKGDVCLSVLRLYPHCPTVCQC